MKTLVIMRFTLKEAIRKKAVLGGLLLTAIFLLLYTVGTFFAFRELNANYKGPAYLRPLLNDEILLSGIYFVNFIAGLLAIFSSVGTISSEIEQGTLHAVVPKPLRRWEIIAGKWLGFAAMVIIYAAIPSAIATLVVFVQSGYLPPNPIGGIAVIALQALLLLSLTMLGTTVLSTVTNGIVVFMLYALALAGGRLEQLGGWLSNDTLLKIGITTSLIIPTDALWRLASSLFGGGIGLFAGGNPALLQGGAPPTDPPSIWMVVYAGVYAVTAIGAAIAIFSRRDL